MIRLDKYLCDCGIGTRSQVKDYIKKGQIKINNSIVKKPEYKLNEEIDKVHYLDKEVLYQSYYYYLLYKPAGVITATEDKKEKTVLDLFPPEKRKNLFPVGRLDKDTEGLLLVTNDGELAHNLLSPKKKIPKTYYVETMMVITDQMKESLCKGVDIGEKEITCPAEVEVISLNSLFLTITEGKFHQVKRMLKAVGNEVTYLKRVSMGTLTLDPNMEKGTFRNLTMEEIISLKKGEGKKC